MNLILIGISGAGKGTQAKLLSQKFGLLHISSGELFRSEYEKKSPQGIAAYQYWSKGVWVPDEVTFALIKIHLDQATNGFVLDGFPRTKNQCVILDEYLKQKNENIGKTIYLKVSENEAVKRIQLRAKNDQKTTGKAREDETEELIRARFKSFLKSVGPVLDYYQNKNLLVEINGERTIEDIFLDLEEIAKRCL